jgi:hypothetical protein
MEISLFAAPQIGLNQSAVRSKSGVLSVSYTLSKENCRKLDMRVFQAEFTVSGLVRLALE